MIFAAGSRRRSGSRGHTTSVWSRGTVLNWRPKLIYNAGMRVRSAEVSERTSRVSAMRTSILCGMTAAAVALAGCSGSQVAIDEALSVEVVTSGWLDVGIDDLGRNKLVPTISFRLANNSDESVRTLQLNGVFRRCVVAYPGQPEPVSEVSPADLTAGTCPGEMQEWGSAYLRAVGREGLEAGAATEPFTMESGLGYTGEQSRLNMLQHREFIDVKVEVFVKRQAEQWVKLGEHSIERQLLTQ